MLEFINTTFQSRKRKHEKKIRQAKENTEAEKKNTEAEEKEKLSRQMILKNASKNHKK